MDRVVIRAVRIGLASARANALPMVVLWTLAALTVLAYSSVPAVHSMCESIARWQRAEGWQSAFVSKAVMCGLLPGVFLASIPSLRPSRLTLTVLSLFVWNGVWGVICDWFFRLQSRCFGSDASLQTLLFKTAVDQFVLTPLFIAPSSAVFFFWMGRDFSGVRVRREWPKRFWIDLVAPNLLSNWCLWIPVTMVVFAMPLDLQIHVSGFFCAFWCLMGLEIGRRTK